MSTVKRIRIYEVMISSFSLPVILENYLDAIDLTFLRVKTDRAKIKSRRVKYSKSADAEAASWQAWLAGGLGMTQQDLLETLDRNLLTNRS